MKGGGGAAVLSTVEYDRSGKNWRRDDHAEGPCTHDSAGGRWAGLRPDSPDHLPILGPADVHGLLIATGHFRSGILLAPITAKLVREWVTEQRVAIDWERFSPMRFVEAHKGAAATD